MAETAAVLVTGAAGFLGQAIVRALARKGIAVVAVDRVAPTEVTLRRGTPNGLVDYVCRDISESRVDDLVAGVSGVIHAAAITPHDETDGEILDALLRINIGAFSSVLAAARASAACSRLIFVSSAAVYDQEVEATLTERDANGASSLYGATKFAAELVGHRYTALSGIDFCIVRPTSLFGAGEVERPSRPRITGFAQLVRASMMGKTVQIVNSRSRADWLSVDDAADAITLLWFVSDLGGRAFNLSSGFSRPFADIVEAVRTVVPLRQKSEDADLVIDGGIDRPAVISNDRIGAAVNWKPRRSLEDGIRDLLEPYPAP